MEVGSGLPLRLLVMQRPYCYFETQERAFCRPQQQELQRAGALCKGALAWLWAEQEARRRALGDFLNSVDGGQRRYF